MLKKTITYENYNGDTVTDDFYFNLTKVECMELEYSFGANNTLSNTITTLVESKDVGALIAAIKKILLMSYGVKTPDGNRFIKNDSVREEFEQSPAFEKIYWDLVTNQDEAASFISGIVPQNVRDSLGENPKQVLLDRMQKSLNETK